MTFQNSAPQALINELYARYNQVLDEYNQYNAAYQSGAYAQDPQAQAQVEAYLQKLLGDLANLEVMDPATGTRYRINPQTGAYEFRPFPESPWQPVSSQPSQPVEAMWEHDSLNTATRQDLSEWALSSAQAVQHSSSPQPPSQGSKFGAVAGLVSALRGWFAGLSLPKKAGVVAGVVLLVMVISNMGGGGARQLRACPPPETLTIVDVDSDDTALLETLQCAVDAGLMTAEQLGEVGVRFRPNVPVDLDSLAESTGQVAALLKGEQRLDGESARRAAYALGFVPSPDVENPALPALRSQVYRAVSGLVAFLEEDENIPQSAAAAAEYLRVRGLIPESSEESLSSQVLRHELAELLVRVYRSGVGVTAEELTAGEDGDVSVETTIPVPLDTVPDTVPASAP